MKKRFLVSLCALMLLPAFLLAGCSGGNDAKGTDTVLSVATNAEFEPFEFMDGNEIVGFDIDLINEVAQKIGMTVSLNNMEFDGTVAAVQSGTCKVAISGMTVTPSREKSVLFSTPYYSTTQVLIVRDDDTVFTGTTKEALDEQLVGKTIGVCAGFTGEAYINGDEDMGFEAVADADTKIFDNISLAVSALKNKSIDVIVMDGTVAKNAAGAAGNDDIRVIDVVLTTEYYAIAIGKDNEELKAKIDQALAEIKDSGKLAELYETWELE